MTKVNSILSELAKNGRKDLYLWEKEEFVACCMQDFGVSELTANRVYEKYHSYICK